MTASTASNSRTRTGIRRPLGRRAAGIVAVSAAAGLGLSACSAGQITQTNTQVSAVTGSTAHMAGGNITVSDIQAVLPTKKAVDAGGPFELAFTASNADPDTAYKLRSIAVSYTDDAGQDGTEELEITSDRPLLCPVASLATPTAEQLEKRALGQASAPPTLETPTGDSGAGTCDEMGDAPSDAPEARQIDTIVRTNPVEIDSFEMPGPHHPGTEVDVTFTFAEADPHNGSVIGEVAPETVAVPINVPQHWDREKVRG